MEKMIAVCGINCYKCLAFIATQADDDDKRAEVAKLWSKEYNADIQAKDVNCEIRKCGFEMRVANCAYCNDYACDKLNQFFDMVPDAKKQLDDIRNSV